MLREWDQLPKWMWNQEVREYYDILAERRLSLKLKRVFDIAAAGMLLGILAVPMAVIAAWISADSPGGAFYRQERVTAYGKRFMICKFRTMTKGAERKGMRITLAGDKRVTKPGKFLRKYRLEGNDIIRQTTKSLINKGFREVSPILFFRGCNLISNELNTMAA